MTLREMAARIAVLELVVVEPSTAWAEYRDELENLRSDYNQATELGYTADEPDVRSKLWRKPDKERNEGNIERWIHLLPAPFQVTNFADKLYAAYRSQRTLTRATWPWAGPYMLPARSCHRHARIHVLQAERSRLMRMDNETFAHWLMENGEPSHDEPTPGLGGI